MPRRSAGLLIYRLRQNAPEVFLVHPGGPFWTKRDLGAWSIPKGEYHDGEDALEAAKREYAEETGSTVEGTPLPLGECKQAGGKIVMAWAVESDCGPANLKSNTFPLEWPPHSGRIVQFPEVDRWEWFTMDEARRRILTTQKVFLDRLEDQI